MSKVFIEEETLIGIGNAIREKSGTTDLIATTDMATAISNLATGDSGGGGGSQFLPKQTTQITGVKSTTATQITFDFSPYIKPYDCLWEFGTCWAPPTSGTSKSTVQISLIRTQIPENTTEEVKIDGGDIKYWQYGKSGTANNNTAIFSTALYVSGYYNPATCQLRLVASTMGQSRFNNNSYVDNVGQLFHRVAE